MPRIHVMVVVGARPQFVKCAPLIKEILVRRREMDLSIVHSGQHYDSEMSEVFFRELMIPKPSLNLHAGSGSHAAQTATIMKRLEAPMLKLEPDVVLVPGDTNTTLAASLTAAKIGIPVAHLEAGMRSGDTTMPEEINRRLTDHCSAILLAPTKTAVRNLKKEGLGKATRLTGDTMVETLRAVMPVVQRRERDILAGLGLQADNYALVTLHRPSNVDNLSRLRKIQLALHKAAKRLRVVFPVHPRTRSRLRGLKSGATSTEGGVTYMSPQGYIETMSLLRNASCLVTDSGGMQKESFLLHVPCITLRSTTEWPETLTGKANQLLIQPEMIHAKILTTAFDHTLKNNIRRLRNPFGDGHSSERIANILEETF